MKISLSMIVKNEENHLRKALDSVQGIDEIVICDTGSEDKTVEIAKEYTDKVFTDYKWNDDFAEARNHSLKKCTGDWILIVDADENLKSSIEDIRTAIQYAEERNIPSILCDVVSIKGDTHKQPRLFKRQDDIFWVGAIHNYVNVKESIDSNITVEYEYSDAHAKDPDRTLRILKREIEKNPQCIREKYYLAREYFYRKDYITALYWYDEYLKVGTWLPERAEAYISAARCLWILRKGDKAREYCAQAVVINANFKEAILFMAEMSFEGNAIQWKKMAETASNANVLFIRNTNNI